MRSFVPWRRIRRNPLAVTGGAIVLLLVLTAVLAPWLAPHTYDAQHLRNTLQPPLTPGHPLGTDEFGRDLLSRLLFGARASLLVGLVTAAMSALIGVPVGLIAGYYGGRVDLAISRIIDGTLAIPPLLLGIGLASIMRPSLATVVAALVAVWWATFARYVRAEAMSVRSTPFCEAARALGARDALILVRHVLPNVMSTVFVIATLTVASAILVEASLSFLGLGIQPPEPSWGGMLTSGRRYLRTAWWLTTFPGLAIVVVVLGFNLLGDGLRDISDPTLRGGR
jgi:peptide/nickel transport system permease protein